MISKNVKVEKYTELKCGVRALGCFHASRSVPGSGLRLMFLLHCTHLIRLVLVSCCNYASELKTFTWNTTSCLLIHRHRCCSLSIAWLWSPVFFYPLSFILPKKCWKPLEFWSLLQFTMYGVIGPNVDQALGLLLMHSSYSFWCVVFPPFLWLTFWQ